jgi:hypothetical protein
MMMMMMMTHPILLLVGLWLLGVHVTTVECSEEEIRKHNANTQVAARIAPIDLSGGTVDEGNGITTQRGRLGIDLDPGHAFSSVTVIEFTGTASAFPTLIQRNATRPTSMRTASSSSLESSSSASSSAVVWYGEEITKGAGSASLMVDDISGHVFGSISDGTNAYSIKTNVVSDQNDEFHFEFEAVSLSELPDEYEAPPRQPQPQQVKNENNNAGAKDASDTAGERGLRGTYDTHHHSQTANKRRLLPDDEEATVVDILVLYTQAAKDKQGGEAAMQNLIDLGIVQTNMAFENSGSDTRVRSVATVEDTTFPDYKDNGSVNPLDALENDNDGYFDNVYKLRVEHGGDIVMLIANELGGYCGAAFLGGYLGTVNRYCATLDGQYSFAHEIGHMFVSIVAW